MQGFLFKHKITIIFLMMLFCSALYAQVRLVVSGASADATHNVTLRINEYKGHRNLSELTDEQISRQAVKALEPFGYFNATATVNRRQNNIYIILSKGMPTTISSIDLNITGEASHNPPGLAQKVRAQFTLKPQDIFVSSTYESQKRAMLQALEQAGFLKATFSTARVLISQDRMHASITLTIDSGLRYYFGMVHIKAKNLNSSFVERYIHFKQGDVYNGDEVLTLNRNLSDSGYFRSVWVNPDISTNPVVPIDVVTEPVPRYSYSLGLGFGTDTGPRGRAGLHIIPVNRDGHRFDAMAQGSAYQNALLAQYIIPGQDPKVSQYRIGANASNLDYNTGESHSMMLSLAHTKTKTAFQRSISINGLYERFNYSGEPKQESTLLYPRLDLMFRQVSNELFSPSGYNISFSVFASARALASSNNIAQGMIDAKAAVFFEAPRLRLYLHGIQGLTAIDNVGQLPLSLAMLLGGNENLKAYSFNSIGPGKQLTFGSIELQKEIRENWYVIGFYDAGTVFSPLPMNMLYDAGIGAMWVSPVGPIKIAVAQPLNRAFETSSKTPRLVINMGPDL